MEAAESSLFPGYRLDRYELLCPIASGGMASVWLARLRGKRGFEKLFAIKTIKTELISDANYQQMFLDEARIASRIVHPNVAQILELGEENDILFLVMEWVDGDSLAKVHRLCLKAGQPFPVSMSLRIVADICAGLHAAHQLKDAKGELLGVVHRDVSPQNVLLSSEGNAKVIDFGLVKAKGRTSAETETGIVKGKIRYMAPEQVGKGSSSIDHRADVWAAGMCLLELVTGHQPYYGLEDLEVVKNLMTPGEMPPIPADVPQVIKNVLAKALVRDPEKRYATCGQMKRALDQAITEGGEAVDTDDIAEFVKKTLPDLGAKRTRTIARAIESADQRPAEMDKYSVPLSAPSSTKSLESSPDAFAVTEVSARTVQANYEDAMPLTRRVQTAPEVREESDPDQIVSDVGATSTGGTSLRDQLHEKKKGPSIGYIVAGIVVVAAAAFILFPRGSKQPPATNVEPQPSASTQVIPSSTVPVDTSQPPPSASAVDMDLPATPTSASAVASASAPDAGKRLSWPGGRPPPIPAAVVDAGPEKPKFNPAWSILTHPPPGTVSGEPAPTPAPEPKPE
jgi:serine/threonine-protein kinase